MYGIINFLCLRHLVSRNFVLKFILKHLRKENKLKSLHSSTGMRPYRFLFFIIISVFSCMHTCVCRHVLCVSANARKGMRACVYVRAGVSTKIFKFAKRISLRRQDADHWPTLRLCENI